MGFRDTLQYKKGRLGEEIYIRLCLDAGIIPYEPVREADVAHPFDMLCVRSKDYSIFLADIKAKPQRHSYPDTGINIRSCDGYLEASRKHNARVWLAFVDENRREVYGNWLHILMQETQIKHLWKTLTYPLRQNGIIFFPVQNMVTIGSITDEEAALLREYSSRSDSHEAMYRNEAAA